MESGSSKKIFQVGDEDSNSISIDSSLEEDSSNSVSSMSSSDLVEDASSSSTSFSSSSPSPSPSNGPLYELSELMAQLPIKRGLSKFYQGKSQSFTSLAASVKNIEDLAKKKNIKGTNCRMKMKSCKSYGGGLDSGHNKSYSPKAKATISKKSRASFLSSLGKQVVL